MSNESISKPKESLVSSKSKIKIPPFPQRFNNKEDDTNFKKVHYKFSNLFVNIPLVEPLLKIPCYTTFMKDMLTKMRVTDFEMIEVPYNYGAMISSNMVVKKKNLGHLPFLVPLVFSNLVKPCVV